MTLFDKLGIGAIVVAAIGASYWYLISDISVKSEYIGQLEGEKKQLSQSLSDSQKSVEQARSEMELWRGLYGGLQEEFEAIQKDRETMSAALNELREQQDVEEYMDCPMPDGLYDWVRDN